MDRAMTTPTPPLSPAAQAVLDAAMQYEINPECYSREIAVAVLRAAADQAIPLTKTPWGTSLIPVLTSQESRDRILAIAAELEQAANINTTEAP
jgi:hypothetical protein